MLLQQSRLFLFVMLGVGHNRGFGLVDVADFAVHGITAARICLACTTGRPCESARVGHTAALCTPLLT